MQKVFLLFFISAFLLSNSASPKSIVNKELGIIKGSVYDQKSNSPLEYATVSIFQNDSLINGSITNSQGYFKIKGIGQGGCEIEISFIGYESIVVEDVHLLSPNQTIDLGKLYLEPKIEFLNEAVVTADASIVTYKIDRKVINTKNIDINESGSAIDVLENYPSINVEMDGSVSLRGSTSFKVLVNNRPSVLEPSDILNQISASSIERIEIITNPAAKYSSEGTSGIINIIQKKNRLEGFNGSIRVNYGMYKNRGGDIILNLKRNRINYYIGFNYNDQGIEGYLKNIFRDTSYDINSEGDYDRTKGSTSFRGGLDFDINSKNYISLQTNIGTWRSGGEIRNNFESYSFSQLTTDIYSSSEKPSRDGLYYNVDLNYEHKFNESGHKISTIISFDNQDIEDGNVNCLEDLFGNITDGKKTKESGPIETYNFQLDYVFPFKSKQIIEIGYKSEISDYNKSSKLQEYSTINNAYEFSDIYSNQINFTKSYHAAYASYANRIKDFGINLGLRAEYTYRKLEQIESSTISKTNRIDYFPTLHLSYDLFEKQQLMGSYSRRLSRPKDWQLEPFYTWYDAFNLRIGNPDLKPEFIDSYELNFMNKWKNNSFSIEIYYRNTKNVIEKIRNNYGESTYEHSYLNVGNSNSLGAEIALSMIATKWWRFNISGNFYNYKLNNDFEEILNDVKSSRWKGRLYNTFTFSKRTRAQLSVMYISPYKSAQGDNQGYLMTNASLRREFFKDLFITISGQGIFGLLEREKTFTNDEFYINNYIVPTTPIFSISVSYKFRNYKYNRRRQGKSPNLDSGEGSM
jgi:outer membrane receptor protein involved in Fe transport